MKNKTEDTNTTGAPAKGLGESAAETTAPSGNRIQDRRQWLITRRMQARSQWLTVPLLILSDVLLGSLFWGLALVLRNAWGQDPIFADLTVALMVANTAAWVGLRALLGLYPGYGLNPVEELRRQTYSTLVTLSITAVLAFGLQAGTLLSRLLVGIFFLEVLLLAPLARHFVKWGMAKTRLWGKPVAIIGADKSGKGLTQTLQEEWGLGFKPLAVFDLPPASEDTLLKGEPDSESVYDSLDLARKQGIDTVIFAMPRVRRESLAKFVGRASAHFQRIIVIPDLAGITTSAVIARDFVGSLGIEIKHNLLNPWARRIKRALDLFGVVVGGLLISPLVLVIVALIKLDSSGPAFYKHRRPGVGGMYFDCWKFRTMRADAESSLAELLQREPDMRAEWEKNRKLRNDPRITRVGRFLRTTSLDELPQIWNVVRGEMSLVGPRPMLIEEIPKYGEVYALYTRVRPGITGLWQVSGRSDTGYEERVAMVAYYVRNWSVWLDLIILARTLGSVISSRGAL